MLDLISCLVLRLLWWVIFLCGVSVTHGNIPLHFKEDATDRNLKTTPYSFVLTCHDSHHTAKRVKQTYMFDIYKTYVRFTIFMTKKTTFLTTSLIRNTAKKTKQTHEVPYDGERLT